MLEVCFNPSVKGSLAFAQRCKKNRIGGAIGIITDKTCIFSFFTKRKALKEYRKRQLQLQQNAISLGGTKEDIAGISFGLSEGDIQSVICLEECPRKAHIRSGFCFEKHNEEENREASLNDFWTACVKDLQKLQSNPPKIRIWLDSTPDAQCGLLFVADLLKESKTAG